MLLKVTPQVMHNKNLKNESKHHRSFTEVFSAKKMKKLTLSSACLLRSFVSLAIIITENYSTRFAYIICLRGRVSIYDLM